jgi:glutamine synthetase
MAKIQETFALESPIARITGKDKYNLLREDLIKVIVEKQIERITFHYTAIDGKTKELKIPIAGRKQAELILTEGERCDGSSLFKGIIDAGSSDLYVVPEYSTAFLNPFDDKSLDFVCRFITPDGSRAPFTPDNILHNAHNLLKKQSGLEFHALAELEFYLLCNAPNNLYPLPKQKAYHASAPFVKGGDILNEIVRVLTVISGNVKYAHHEVGCLERIESDYPEINGKRAEQVEVEFLLSPVEEAADIATMARWIIRNIAYQNNCVATFVPKLEVGHAGNGMHFHTALMKNGKNAMTDAKGNLSKESKALIGGLCHYAPTLTAFGNMVSASYLRLVPNQEAPTKVCWSECNRSALIRVPLGWTKVNNLTQIINPQQTEKMKDIPGRQTVELRSPDGSGFTHLLLSGVTMAAQWGLKNEKESLDIAEQSHVKGNIHKEACYDNLTEIATSCVESAETLLKDRKLYERDNIFPRSVIEHVASVLHNENDKNLNKRLLALPDDEKMKESHRIMHRDIHKH